MISGVPCPGEQAALEPEQAWRRFYDSGRAEDYICYAQLMRRKAGAENPQTAGVSNADQNTGIDHQGTDHRRK